MPGDMIDILHNYNYFVEADIWNEEVDCLWIWGIEMKLVCDTIKMDLPLL